MLIAGPSFFMVVVGVGGGGGGGDGVKMSTTMVGARRKMKKITG